MKHETKQWILFWSLVVVVGSILTWETLSKIEHYKQSVIQNEIISARILRAVEHAETCECPH